MKDRSLNPSKQWKRWFLETLVPYDAHLVFESHDEYGGLRVIDLGPYRAMYFDSPSCQGRIHLKRPWEPSSEYLRSMLCGAMMASNIKNILILGLGPGALVQSLAYLYPQAQIHTVELRSLVHEVALKYFAVPQGDHFQHHVIDATDFLKGTVDIEFDLIMVDMAMSHSVSPLLVQPGFWTYSLKHLKSSGVMCVNLWKGAEHRFEWIFNRLGSSLKAPPTVLRHKQLDNMVVFGSPTVLESENIHHFVKRIKNMAEQFQFDPELLIQQLPINDLDQEW
jgi:spermidine synthase